jgi:creatinine amidohydrolase
VPDPEKYWPGGVWGDPGAANSERGKIFIERSAEELAKIVRDLASLKGR